MIVDETEQTEPTVTRKTKKGKKGNKRKQIARRNLTRYQNVAKGKVLLEPIQEKLEISSDEEEKIAVKSDPKTSRSVQAPELIEPE